MKSRRWPLISALVAMGLLAASGCHRGGSHSSSSSSSSSGGSSGFSTHGFPGPSVHDGDVGGDEKAWSPPGTDVVLGSLKCTPDGDRGTMMATYAVRTSGPPITDTLMGQYYNGKVWTPPVVLSATDASFVSGSVDFKSIIHSWINTDTHLSELARDRDGDCVIFWKAVDADQDGLATADDVNSNLFSTYFNSRQSGDVSKRYGFQEFASRLSLQDELGEDVTSFGVATDGLCGEARWSTGKCSYRYGEATTGIVVFWNQRENNNGTAGFEDRALYSAFVQLDAGVDPEFPLATGDGISAPTRIVIDGMGASDTGSSSEETQVDHMFVSYNGFLAFRVAADNTTALDDVASHVFDPGESNYNGATAAGEDSSLETVTFDLTSGLPGPSIVLHAVTPVTSTVDTLRNDADFLHKNLLDFVTEQQDTFGPDEGLANIVMFSAESDNDTNDTKDDAADAGGLAISEVDASTGALISHKLVSGDDAAISDFVDSRLTSARISRNGDYLMVAWNQADAEGLTADLSVKVAEYLTTRPDEDGLFTVTAITDSLSVPVDVNADTDGFSVAAYAFQDGLGYICGAQSDPDVMNIAFAHRDATNDRLFVARIAADQVTPVLPVVTATVLEVDDFPVYSLATQVNDQGFAFKITDSGEGGNVFAVYNADVDSTAGTDIRVFAERTGLGAGSGPIDSNVLFRQAGMQDFTLVGTPPGESIGRFDPGTSEDSDDRPHGYSLIHVFFREQKSSESSGLGFAVRTRVFDTSDSGLAFGDSFFPNAGLTFAAPFDLDLPFIDPGIAEDAFVRGIAVEGNTLGFWFTETGHVWYQEFNPPGDAGQPGWIDDGGFSSPLLVDDDTESETASDEPVGFFHLFVTRTCTCSTLHGATVFYSKTADDFSSAERLHVRTRE